MTLATPQIKARPWFFLALAMAVTIAGVLALGQQRVAEADIQSVTLDTNVIFGSGTVVATFVADEDAETEAEAVQIFVSNEFTTSLTEDACTTSLGAGCAIASVQPCTVGPFLTERCAEYLPVAGIDANATAGTFTATFSIAIDCSNGEAPRLIDITVLNFVDTDGFQEQSAEGATILCFPDEDDPNIRVYKDFPGGDQNQTFEYQLNYSSPSGCWASAPEGATPVLIPDGGTFTVTPEDAGLLFCGPGEYTITELQGAGWVFVSASCVAPTPEAAQVIPGSAQTVTIPIDGFPQFDCRFENRPEDPTIPDLTIEKVCVGEPDATFEVTLTRGEGPGVSNPIECAGSLYFPDLLAAEYTIEELIDGPDAAGITTSIDCGPAGTSDTADIVITVPEAGSAPATNITCVITNTFTPGDDDPTLPNISATKVCVGEGFDAAFEVTVADVTETAGCGDTVTAVDVEPGAHEVGETISGDDAEAFVTVIVCSDGSVTEGSSATVTIPEEGAVDVACVIINSFDPGLADLICPCPCGCLNLEIDLDNRNTNTIGIDNDNTNANDNANNNENENENKNENKNDNVNTNTQNQENAQDQDNTNEQTNNIDSSPEVNIDFD